MEQNHSSAHIKRNSNDIIEMIATETHRPFEEVRRVYEDEYARLKSDARIFDYLALFATRQTRAVLARTH